ncbi:MAG: twin-arginine translocase TatA/TatE family subunit [Hyphomicrobiales bacterium]|nr:twin-arginine translocase TatA/TatE family subunit [Hyphomicrobiales bacterium]PCJ90905.1 MAG: twin-arginine translocase TatA/TatE family subunit [Hyphomicrobiales bacterium]
MGISFWQIAIVAVLIILLFGRGKISDLMGDVAKGIKSFKTGLADDDTDAKTIEQQATETVAAAKTEDKQAS